jgi:GT2 family glycosyltransferase
MNLAKTLLAVTTYNQLDYTKIFYQYFSKLKLDIDLIVIDDCSTDDTVNWCIQNNIKVITKNSGHGVTHSWNLAYQYFKDNDHYDYLIIASNDIAIPIGAIEELLACHKKWPSICIVPLTTANGCGHSNQQSVKQHYSDIDDDIEYVQDIQNRIISLKELPEMKNRQFLFDPFRMLLFNGFFFSLKRSIINFEREDGFLFNPEFLNYKNEDNFNWSILIPNDEYPMLCKTSYIHHFKGKSFSHINDKDTNDLEAFLKNR